jgi:hypothetical protein
MPIKSCTLPGGGSGYKWGNHGKCYKSRKQAQRQAAAAFANGYKGEGSLSTEDKALFDEVKAEYDSLSPDQKVLWNLVKNCEMCLEDQDKE